MATREATRNIGDNLTQLGRDAGRRTSTTMQGLFDRMLRTTGSGANSTGQRIETSFTNLADSLPINTERAHTRRTRLAIGGLMLAGAGTMYRFRQQIGERITQFRTAAEDIGATELQPTDTLDQAGATATPATTQTPTMPAHPVRPPAEQQRTPQHTAATTLETGTN